MNEQLENWLKSLGINSFDDLRDDEKKEYFKWLQVAEKSAITLDDIKKHIHQMRVSIEMALVDEDQQIFSKILPFLKRTNPRFIKLQARLKNYLLLEELFERPQKARDMLEQYQQFTKIGGGQ
jgi:RNA:NAD 2'-phosphotransferase (TPT1/KptA family)